MILSEYAKAAAGLFGRNAEPPREMAAEDLAPCGPLPVAERCPEDPDSRDDGTVTWLPAGLVELGDEVNIDGVWHTVTGTDIRTPRYDDPGFAVLHFDGGSHRTGYVTRVYVRDEATIIGEQIRGGA